MAMKKIYATQQGAKAIYLFIAELNGFKQGTEADKVEFGKECYINHKLHNPDVTTEEGRKDFHEDIWLGRLYADLDKFYELGDTTLFTSKKRSNALAKAHHSTTHLWTTPIELDASASMIQYIGVLLNDRRLMDMTNIIGDTLSDPWAFDGIPRTQFKHAATPMLYGSSKPCYELWQDKGHKYTQEQVKAFNAELADGAFGLANAFKDFLINYCKPSETMEVTIHKDTFTIACNRYKNVGDKTTAYSIYDSVDGLVNNIYHTHTHKEADLEQFRRYFVTLLV